MGILPLIWSGLGLLIGLIVHAAGLYPTLWKNKRRLNWFSALIIGAIVSICGGWLGLIFFGRLFSVVMALWITIALIILLPWGITRIQKKY